MTSWLADKSAIVRWGSSPDADVWAERIERGLVRVTTVTRLEVGYSSRSEDELRRTFATPPLASMPVEYVTPAIEDRSLEVQAMLAGRGQHRGPSIPGLLIAATAELAKLTVLHVDRGFDLIGALTGQPLERLQV